MLVYLYQKEIAEVLLNRPRVPPRDISLGQALQTRVLPTSILIFDSHVSQVINKTCSNTCIHGQRHVYWLAVDPKEHIYKSTLDPLYIKNGT